MKKSGCFPAVVPATLFLFLIPVGRASGQGWSGPVAISSGTRDADTPQVATGPAGRAVAAFSEWSEIVPGMFSMQLSYANFFDGSSWGTAQRIDVPDGWESDEPQVAMDAGGNACAVFVEYTSDSHVYFNYWDGSAWSGAAPVDDGLGRQTSWPEIAMDGSGNAMTVFQVHDTYDQIFAGYRNGSTWTSIQIISPLGADTNADSPDVAMDAAGNAIAVWRQYGSPNRIYGRHWNGSGWAASTTIDMGWGNNALAPQVAMDGSGNAVVVFFHNDGSHQRACANWWNGSTWSGATTIDPGPGESAIELAVALNNGGRAAAVYIRSDGTKNRAWAAFGDGSSWSSPEIVDSGTWTKAEDAAVGIDGSGRAVAAFTEFSETGSFTGPRKLYASLYDGSAWSAPVRVDWTTDSYSSGHPQVAVDPSGHAIVVFDQGDGYDNHVYANRYVFPAIPSGTWNYDYNGDGTSEIAIYRESSGLWAVRGLTRAYFGGSGDIPVPGDYNGDGTTDPAVFRGSSGLWAVRGLTRAYFGGASDTPLSRDYDGDGTTDPAVFRDASSLWVVRGLTRAYFGASGDDPIPGDYRGYGTAEIAIFRAATGLWAARAGERLYYGGSGDFPVPAAYDSYPGLDPAIFRPATGLWAVRGITRVYFGGSADETVPADYNGDGVAEIGIFRESSSLWAVRGTTRAYFGSGSDVPVTR